MPTEREYVVSDTRRLYHCFDKDGWLLEQVETKYPTCGEKPEPTIADRLREALRARLAA
jgi:hypothetical protein